MRDAFAHRPEDASPIFVVGPGRSGTTLMQLLLSAHPRIYICHEVSFYNWESICPARVSGERFLRGFFQTLGFRWLGLDPDAIVAKLPQPLPRHESWRAFDEIMRQKAASVGKVRYGDKTPAHVNLVRKLFRDFPRARVISMVRDPRRTVGSASRMPWGSESDMVNGLVIETARKRLAPFADRVLTVRLEDLQDDPRREMARVLDYVGEPWDDAVLDHPAHRADPNDIPPFPWLEQPNERIRPGSSGFSNLTPTQLRVIEMVCRKSMEVYGYEPAQLEDAPGKPGTILAMLASAPAALRYSWLALGLATHLKDPDHWAWENPKSREYFFGLNPRCWELYPGFVVPEAPPLPVAYSPAVQSEALP